MTSRIADRFRDSALLATVVLVGVGIAACGAPQPEKPAHAEYVRKMIPTSIAGTYQSGKLTELRVRGRMAYLVEPTGKVDPQKRWVWTFPFWLAINDGHGRLQHRFYVERLLAAGLHVAGIDVGTSCGSPSAANVCHEFYHLLVAQHGLNPRARLIGQSKWRTDRVCLGVSPSGVCRPDCRNLPGHGFSDLARTRQRRRFSCARTWLRPLA